MVLSLKWAPKGRPKYFIGSEANLQPNKFPSLKLIFQKQHISNRINFRLAQINLQPSCGFKPCKYKPQVLYLDWISITLQPSKVPTLKPVRYLPWTARSIILLKASITITKGKGDRGSPCLKPLVLPKKPLGQPLMSTKNRIVEMQNRIQLLHFDKNPQHCNI